MRPIAPALRHVTTMVSSSPSWLRLVFSSAHEAIPPWKFSLPAADRCAEAKATAAPVEPLRPALLDHAAPHRVRPRRCPHREIRNRSRKASCGLALLALTMPAVRRPAEDPRGSPPSDATAGAGECRLGEFPGSPARQRRLLASAAESGAAMNPAAGAKSQANVSFRIEKLEISASGTRNTGACNVRTGAAPWRPLNRCPTGTQPTKFRVY
jgi:hypothetical protein